MYVVICYVRSNSVLDLELGLMFSLSSHFFLYMCRASEGKTVEVEYRGDINATVQDILGGVRSTCTYVGAQKLKELSRRTTFIRVTQQLNTVFK